MSVKNPRGTDNAALAAFWTAVRAGYIDELAAANIPADVDVLKLAQAHDTFIFPDDTGLICILTAGGTNNAFDAWTEIVDSTTPIPITLSSKFTSNYGHITAVQLEDLAEDERYQLEIAYGDGKVSILRHRFLKGLDKKTDLITFIRIRADYVPIGETVYYRMMCSTASKTCEVSFRYHYH